MSALFGFPGGIEPPEQKKQSSETPIEILPLPPLLVLPLKQHIGAHAIPVVQEGDQVHRGQLIARADGELSAPLHSPADGVVSFIGFHPVTHDSGMRDNCIAIATEEQTREILEVAETDASELTDEDIRERIAAAGIVGQGGAGFPTVAKLTDQTVHHLIINGAECEPYITCDDRLMRDRTTRIVEGIRILERLLRPEAILFAIEDNKPDAIKAVSDALFETNIEVVVIPTRYPSGAQKQLIQNLLDVEIPAGKHSIDEGIVMYNVGTCYAIAHALSHSVPLLTRVVTVTGDAVTRPGNYVIAIGTPIDYVLECAGVNPNKLARVILGGPLMGVTVNDLSAPITKISNCLIAAAHGELDEDLRARECIRCGDCVDVCPASLLPHQLYWFIRSQQHDKAAALHLSACIECGACAYVCPSHIPLVHYYRHGKSVWRTQQNEQRLANEAKERFDWRQLRHQRETGEKDVKRVIATPTTETAAVIDNSSSNEIASDDKASHIAAAVARAKAKREAIQRNALNQGDSDAQK